MTDRETIAAILDLCGVEWWVPINYFDFPTSAQPMRGNIDRNGTVKAQFQFFFKRDGSLVQGAWHFDNFDIKRMGECVDDCRIHAFQRRG